MLFVLFAILLFYYYSNEQTQVSLIQEINTIEEEGRAATQAVAKKSAACEEAEKAPPKS